MAATYENHPRWFSLNDGTTNFKATLYEALKYSEDITPIGGSDVIRMLNGTAVKQTNWSKRAVSISGSGGLPIGMHDLDFTLPITLSCGTPRSIVRPTNDFAVIPAHRTDTGYAPYVLKYVDGVWVPLTAAGVGTKFMCIYYPVIVCFFEEPDNSYEWDASQPSSWSLKGEEI